MSAKVPWSAYLWSTGILAVAAFFLGQGFPGWWPSLLLLGLALLPAALVLGGALLGVPRLVVPTVLTVLTLVGAVLVLMGAPRVGPATTDPPVWRLLLDAVPRLLSTPPARTARLDLVAPVAAIVVLVTLAVLVRVLVRGTARTTGIAHVVGAAVLYLSGQLLTAGRADRYGLVAALLVVLVLLSWVRLRLATVGAVLACGACATAVAAAGFPAGKDIRAVIDPPKVSVFQPNLLPYLQLWSDQTDVPLFRLSGDVPDRITLAVYTGYDGSAWSSGTSFAVYGSAPVAPLPGATLTDDYAMTVQVRSLPFDWVPSAGQVTSVSREDLVQDLTGGGLLAVGKAGSPSTYRITGTIDVTTDQTLENAAVPDATVAGAYLQQPPLTPALAAWLRTQMAPYTTRYEQAAALEAILRENRSYDPKASGGSSMASVSDLVLRPAAQGGQRGTQEQFASAYAVFARAMGLPTRLVVGARTSDVLGVENGTSVTVMSGDVSVWPEVYFDDAGWVPFAPTPKGPPTPQQEKNASVRDGSTGDDADQQSVDVPVAQPSSEDASTTGPTVPWGAVAAWAGGGVGVLVVLALLGSAVAGVVVHLRLRRAGPPGAWSVVERSTRLAGVRVPAAWTTTGVVDEVGRVAGGTVGAGAARVATAAERSAYAPEPGPDEPVWREAVEVRRALRRTVPWWRRPWWWVSPASWR